MRVDPRGRTGPTPGQARESGWRRTTRGLYVPASTPRTTHQRILETAMVIPDSGAITGWAALAWCGGTWFDGLTAGGRDELPVTLVTAADDVRRQAGFEVSHERLDPAEVVFVHGIPVVVPARAVFFEMRYAASMRAAVLAMDMAAADDLTTIADVAAYAYAHPGWTGVGQARDALPWCDENSWSPWETRLRLMWVLDAGLGRPLCNAPVFDLRGHLLGTPDLLEPASGTYGEYDGAVHLSGQRRAHDLRREQRFREHGLEGFVVVADDMRRPVEVTDRMVATYRRAVRTPAAPRAWTLTPPTWWQPSHTVELRRALHGQALAALQRRRALRAS